MQNGLAAHVIPCVLALTASMPAGAQARPRIAVEATVGAGYLGGGSEFTSRGGYALDALWSGRLRPAPAGGAVVAVNGAMQGPVGSNDMCTFSAQGGCMPDQPIFYAVGALVGWESRTGTLRALAGPASVQADGGGRAVGLQARLDAVSPSLLHVAAVFSVRGTLVPNYRGDALGLLALGVGLRLR